MDAKRWQKINDLFDAALELEPARREKFLAAACAGDEDLRSEVENLLASFAEGETSFLEKPAIGEVASLIIDKQTAARPRETNGKNREDGFVAGTILENRYRIIGLLGKGGMGEVYQAEDLKLEQTVALKFLPDELERNDDALKRFIGEVRTARRVAHPNVCKVFDIGETRGRHFLSMEFIRGDDLSSLLRRIGRLPSDKAVEIARQLCLGLHSIHEAGILHRDLKPANVIIDNRGRARITDFGIAGFEGELKESEIRVGTPAYMSPEQITGREVSARSDIYSLGLLLYEIFTGKPAFEADSIPKLIRKHQRETPTGPSVFVPDLDPLVEQVIFRCLEKNPAARPASALQVALALPGGNPLEAALAAGETPSPEMVAAAPKKGALRPAAALLLLAGVLLGSGLLMAMSKRVGLHRFVPLDKSPEVLRERGRELAAKFGYPAADSHHGFVRELDYLDYLKNHDQSAARWQKLAAGQPAVIKFWYRQSPEPLVPLSGGTVTTYDPPPNVSGMAHLYLDTEGRLIYFDAVPPRVDADAPANFDWASVFSAAGLNIADFRETASEWSPVRAYDERRAWAGKYPMETDVPVRIEAAAYRGRVVAFQIVEPWSKPAGQVPYQGGVSSDVSGVILLSTFFAVLFVGAWLAIRNVRGGRSDLRGTFRLAAFLFALRMLAWVFQTHHVGSREELGLFLGGLQSGLFWACFAGLLYLAFEPYLRKYAPERVISWNRLLAGDWRDPLVGRDILVGAAAGLTIIIFSSLHYFIPVWLWNAPPPAPQSFSNPGGAALLGLRGFPVLFLNQISASLVFGFMVSFLILFLTLILRRKWLGYAAFWVFIAGFALAGDTSTANLLSGAIWALVFPTYLLVVATRFGVLAIVSGFVFHHLVVFYPVTTELSAWYAGDFALCLLALLALAVFGFYTSLAGQKIFEPGFLKDIEG
ncbi:MAG TPA: serine/threonine-protein kinase [Pyrinomonadaceae bacterium]|jgi:serine/threonine-protein kinase